jgi:hypothetical protein
MSEPLEVTRRQLREYLIPATGILPGQDDDGDHFPRSKVMRFAFNPRNRHLLMWSGSVLALVFTRMAGTRQLGVITGLARSFMRSRN